MLRLGCLAGLCSAGPSVGAKGRGFRAAGGPGRAAVGEASAGFRLWLSPVGTCTQGTSSTAGLLSSVPSPLCPDIAARAHGRCPSLSHTLTFGRTSEWGWTGRDGEQLPPAAAVRAEYGATRSPEPLRPPRSPGQGHEGGSKLTLGSHHPGSGRQLRSRRAWWSGALSDSQVSHRWFQCLQHGQVGLFLGTAFLPATGPGRVSPSIPEKVISALLASSSGHREGSGRCGPEASRRQAALPRCVPPHIRALWQDVVFK